MTPQDLSLQLTSKGGPIKAFNLATFTTTTGTDGPFSGGYVYGPGYDSPECDTQIAALSALGCTSIALQLTWATSDLSGTDVSVGRLTETRAAMTRAVSNAITNGLDCWVKIQIFLADDSSRGGFSPGGPKPPHIDAAAYRQWFANYWSMFAPAMDALEAAAVAAGGHIYGVILTSELDTLVLPGTEDYWRSLFERVRARYATLKIITNMPTGYQGLGKTSPEYRSIFDVLCCDTYCPLNQPGDPAPTKDEAVARLAKAAYGGSHNYVAKVQPPIGLAGTNICDYLKGLSQAAGKMVIFGEDGYCSYDGTSNEPGVPPAAADAGTPTAFNEQSTDWEANLEAYYDPKQASWFGGSFCWIWWPYNDITQQSIIQTNEFAVQQKPAIKHFIKKIRRHLYTNGSDGRLRLA